MQELLRRGANPNRKNQRGYTPLDLAGSLLPPTADVAPDASPALGSSSSTDSDSYGGFGGFNGGKSSVGSPRSNNNGDGIGGVGAEVDGELVSSLLEKRKEECAGVRDALHRAQEWERHRPGVSLSEKLVGSAELQRNGGSSAGRGGSGASWVTEGRLGMGWREERQKRQQKSSGMGPVEEGRTAFGRATKRSKRCSETGSDRVIKGDVVCRDVGVDGGEGVLGGGLSDGSGVSVASLMGRLCKYDVKLMRHVIGFL